MTQKSRLVMLSGRFQAKLVRGGLLRIKEVAASLPVTLLVPLLVVNM